MRGPGRRPHPKKRPFLTCLLASGAAEVPQSAAPPASRSLGPSPRRRACKQTKSTGLLPKEQTWHKLATEFTSGPTRRCPGAACTRATGAQGNPPVGQCAAPVARPARACIQACWAPASPTLYQYYLLYFSRDYVFNCPHNSLGSTSRAFSQ